MTIESLQDSSSQSSSSASGLIGLSFGSGGVGVNVRAGVCGHSGIERLAIIPGFDPFDRRSKRRLDIRPRMALFMFIGSCVCCAAKSAFAMSHKSGACTYLASSSLL